MAFYGSSAANLSPILFKGNLFSEGVNIVFFTDVSFSMGFDPTGETDYTDRPTTNLIPGTQISVGSTVSMFYDGLFPSVLQNDLIIYGVGSQFQSSPNLYTYIDQTLRQKSTLQTLTKNTESFTFPSHIIIGDNNYNTERSFRNLWENDYINNDQGVFTQSVRFNIASKIASESTETRFLNFDVADNPGQYSEDVHGNIWSLYYSGAQSGNQITDGRVSTSYIGGQLNSIIRRNFPTYVIAASNEQENTAQNLIGIGISTKNNVGYTTDKYLYNDGGFYARRYQGYFLDPDFNPGASSGNIETWIRTQANAWPFGSRTFGINSSPNLSSGENAPGINWFIGGNPVNSTTGLGGVPKIVYANYSGGGTQLSASNPAYQDETISKTPSIPGSLNPSEKGAFWGPIFEIDRLRSDINGYTLMVIGYFAPQTSGAFSFNLQSNGASFLWIGCDSGTSGIAGPDGPDGYGPNSKVYSGWTVDNATIQCPASAADRNDIFNNPDGEANDVFASISPQLNFTAGRFYPFRLILGNPPIGGNDFSPDGDLSFSSDNPSFVRLLFDTNTSNKTGSKDITWNLNGNGYFFGGKEVWEEGSLFFPPPVTTVTRTIEEEVKYRNLRVIGISNYDSDDGYDAVFVKRSGQEYLYANLSRHSFTFTGSNNPPATWRFGSYFEPIVYGVTDTTPGFTRQNNPVTENSTVGTGASFRITKLNDRYITEVVSGFAGTDYRIGDKFTISNTLLGESSTENNLVINVQEVQPLEYTVTTTIANNFAERSTTAAIFSVKKNELSNNTYTLSLINGGSNYEPGDRLLIPGTSLDGTSPTNDIIITVSTVLSGGIISTYTFTGTPTNYISYTVPLNEYFPKDASFSYQPFPEDLIFYRKGNNSGIAYTTARITGIAYTTRNITGIAQSSFNITGIAYTNITTPGIAYSTTNIIGIGYTILSDVGIAFTHGNVTGISYTTANITGNGVGFTTTSVVSIGYTTPNVVSIGYTAFRISSISYPDAIQVESYDPNNGDTTTVNVSLNALDQYPTIGDGKAILTGTGDPIYDNIEYSFIVADSDTIILQNTPVSGNPTLVIAPETARLIITELSSSDPSGIGTALLTTDSNHTFVSGDSIIIRGTEIPNWNSTFTIQEVINSTSFYIQNSGTVGLFTGTSIGVGATVGYDQSELELKIIPGEYEFSVGMGITIFGVTGESEIYNDGYTIIGIKEDDPSILILKENQTPPQLVLPGTNGKIGIHTISGIATVTNTSEFGSPGSTVSIKIQNASSSFFNNTFSDAVILDSARILLGSNSFRNSETPNPFEYSSSSNTNDSTITGLVNSNLKVTYGTISPSGYTFGPGASIRILGTANYNGTYTVNSVNGNTLTLNTLSNSATDFSLRDTSGTIGITTIGPVISFNNSFNFPSPYFGSTGTNIQVKIQGTGLPDLNTNTARNARIISSNSILLIGNGLDPSSYSNPGVGGTVGLIGANYTVKAPGANIIPTGSLIGIQNEVDQFGNTYIIDNLFTVSSNIGDNNTLIVIAQPPLGPGNSNTDFGIVGTGGILGLRENAVVTTDGNHPFIDGDTIQIENTTGNSGAFNGIRTIKYVSPTSFILNNTNSIPFTDDFTDANATGGIAGLENYPATVTSTSHPFLTGQSVKIENTTNFDGTYTITKIDDNRFTLNGKINPTSYTEISNSTIDPNSLITLSGNFGPTITYNGTPRIVGGTSIVLETGDQIRIQNSTTFNGVYTVKKYTNTTFGIAFTDPSSFVGVNEGSGSIAGLIGSKARVRSTNHGLIDGQSVKIQNTGTTFDNKLYTVTNINANLFDLNPTVSTGSTDFTITSTVGLIGLQNYPATATFSSLIPSSFAVGSQIDIVDIDGTSASATSQQLSLPGPYTIAWRSDGTVTRLGLQEAINPVNYSIVENNSGAGYTAGLRNSPARLFFSANDFSNLTFGLTLNIGDNIPINISGTDNFNGNYTAKYTSTNTLDLISPSTINPSDYNPNGDLNGLVGLANSNRILRNNSGHGFTASDIGITQIYINTGSSALQSEYGGTYTIAEIINSTNIALSNTQIPPTNYSIEDGEGYYVIAGNGLRMNSTYVFNLPPAQTIYQPHLLDQNDGITISGLTNTIINGNYSVSSVLNTTQLLLSGPYPSPILDAFGRPDYTITDNGFYNARSGLINGNSNSGASLAIRRNATGTSSNYTINSIVTSGAGYKTNELYRIRGSLLGGIDGTNDGLLKIGSVGASGEVLSTNLSFLVNSTTSVPDPSLDYESPFNASIITGNGSNAQFRIVRNGKRTLGVTTYSTVQLLSGGSGYSINEVIRIPGNQLGGTSGDGTSSNLQNDLLIYIENVLSGSITGTGFTFRGTSRDSAPLISSGLSTAYVDGGVRRSRPFGLEKVWDNITDGNPPSNQGRLRQTHDMLTLAEANKGAVVKIDKVYTYGDIQKKAKIQEVFFYATSTIGAPSSGNSSFEASIVYDTGGNSGIATIIFDNDDNDQEVFYNVSDGDTLYFFTSLRGNINNGVPFIDYRLINQGLNVVRAYSDGGSGSTPVSSGNFVFDLGSNPGFAFGQGIDQIVVQTTNTSATVLDNIVDDYKGIFINEKSVLTVRSDGHPFINGDTVTLRFNRLFDVNPGPPTFVEEGTGIAYTSYRVRNSLQNSFQLEDLNGNPITPSTIMPNGRKLIDNFADVYKPANNTSTIPNWTISDQSELYGAPGSTWSLPPHPIIYASQDVQGNDAPVGTEVGDIATLTRALLSIEGEAYTLVPGGKHPIDNRVGLAKAISKFIADTSSN